MRLTAENRLHDTRILILSCLLAFLLQAGALVLFSMVHSSPSAPAVEVMPPLEAQIYQAPPPPEHLKSDKAAVKNAPQKVLKISQTPSAAAKPAASLHSLFDEKNEVEKGQVQNEDHGPVVVSSPSPQIPPYLLNEILKASVVIEFKISSVGVADPSLIKSSGNEELDAIALKTAKTWKFQPALAGGKAIDSRIRLRINFEVQ